MNDKEKKPGNPWTKSLLIWAGVLLALVLFVQMIDGGSRTATGQAIPYSEFVKQVDEQNVRTVIMSTSSTGNSTISGKLANPWTFHFPGVSIKPHPSGSLTHPGMGAMLELIRKHDIKPQQVKRVTVGTNQNMPNALIHHQPKNELQAKFSMEFCMAILLLERKAGLQEFTDEVVNRPDVQAMIQKVGFGVHPEAEAAGFDKMTTIIEVELDDGKVLKTRADFGKGSPANPMTDDELSGKFRECAAWGGLDKAKTEEVLKLLWKIDQLPDVTALTRLLRK